jgi:hypothetical protein
MWRFGAIGSLLSEGAQNLKNQDQKGTSISDET